MDRSEYWVGKGWSCTFYFIETLDQLGIGVQRKPGLIRTSWIEGRVRAVYE